MDASENFLVISGLICEPARARMLWNLLDGRAYTATELAAAADLSATSASNHLARLLEADLLKVETQGRHRYYSFANAEVAYAVESLANLAGGRSNTSVQADGVKYCRTCYDHLAGFVAVRVVDALQKKDLLTETASAYEVTGKGWEWLRKFEIFENDLVQKRRPLTRQCLDWSERRPHLAGLLGARLLDAMLEKKWFERIRFSRELILLPKGKREISEMLGISL